MGEHRQTVAHKRTFSASLTNDPLLERIKTIAHDSMTNERVKRKLMGVLASWHRQFKDDPRMSVVAGLYQAAGGGQKRVILSPDLSFTDLVMIFYSPPLNRLRTLPTVWNKPKKRLVSGSKGSRRRLKPRWRRRPK